MVSCLSDCDLLLDGTRQFIWLVVEVSGSEKGVIVLMTALGEEVFLG